MRKKGDANDFFGSASLRNGEKARKKARFWLTDAEKWFCEKNAESLFFRTGKGRTGVFLNVIFSLLPHPGTANGNHEQFVTKKF
ncbi:MAG: hypothetical protein WA194_05295 [Patescibacteria group bacterium]